MDALVWVRALYAIAIVALVLFVLQRVLRTIQRGGTLGLAERIVEVLETTPLAHGSALHLVRVARRYYVVSGSQANASLICEVPADAVDAWRAARRLVPPAGQFTALYYALRLLKRDRRGDTRRPRTR